MTTAHFIIIRFLIPSGGGSWGGDDWHHWAWLDTKAALQSSSDWKDVTQYEGPGPDIKDLLVVGHSNGGQGTYCKLDAAFLVYQIQAIRLA